MKPHQAALTTLAHLPARLLAGLSLFTLGAILCLVTGCRTTSPSLPLAESATSVSTNSVRLNPGDVIQVSFPGTPAMPAQTQRVQLNGNVQMPLIGEVAAAGKTPTELQAELVKAYDKHLQNKEVLVVVSSASASVFVTGAVLKPGRISMERPLTVLDAIMEAGGFDQKRANVKKVTVIHQKDGVYSRDVLNLKPVLKGENLQPFYLKPFDTVYVPEKLF